MSDLVFGRNPVMEALKSGREVNKVLVAELEGSFLPIVNLAKKRGIPIQQASRRNLDELTERGKHQGVLAYVAPKSYLSVEALLEEAEKKGDQPLLVALDHLEDPHNLGAILRVVDAMGAHGVIITKARSVSLSATVGKTSAGAMEYVPVARVSNLSQTLLQLKKQGLWIAGLEGAAQESIYDLDWKMPLVLVVGAEGEGLSRLIRDNCDFLVHIPMKGQINSLNASVAAAVALYEGARQRWGRS
ncbi:MAG: 23S rRNA (guanosine(2251)-2'-O)-methyltransferase RlmB [Bacillota bacterium]